MLELIFNSLDRALLAGPASEALSSALLFRGPLLAPRFADELAKALRDFATPMQVVPLLEMLSTRCAALVAQLPKSGASADGTQSPDGTPAKKRRKVGASAIEQGQGVEVSSTLVERLAVNLQLVALVLSHVPLPAPIRSDAAAAVRDIYSRVLQPALRTAFIPNPDAAQTRKSETLAACALRTRYAILGRNWRGDAQEDETDTAEEGDGDQVRVELEKGLDGVREELCERLASGVPEMRVEIVSTLWPGLVSLPCTATETAIHAQTRTLLHRIASDLSREEPSTSYTALLSVSSVLSSSMLSALRDGSVPANEPWDGRLHDLDAAHLGIAMWTMLTTRWAALLDRAAYPELLDQLSATLIDSFAGSSEDANSTVARLLPVSLRLVRNAAFLEMPNWRRAIISVAISATEELLKMPRSQRSSFMSSSPKPIRVEKRALLRMMNALVALGRLPIDYTPRAQREVLFSAAVWADAALGVGASEYASESDQANWAALRFFMRAVLEQQETVTAITVSVLRLLSTTYP